MELNGLQKAIVATVAYYDALDFPLTGFEIFKYLINPMRVVGQEGLAKDSEIEPIHRISLKDVLQELSSQNLNHYLNEKNGFYFLIDREHLVETRIDRQKLSDERWKTARKFIKLMQIIPFIKMVAVSGSLAMYNSKNESDIDLLIIAKNKRIWTVRFFTILFFQILGRRRHGTKTQNRFCLNHYLTDKSLRINFPSLYNAQTYSHLVAVLETEKSIYKKFQQENFWINDYLVFYDLQKLGNQKKIKINRFLILIARIQEIILSTFIGLILEKILGFFLKKHIKNHPLRDKSGGRIVADDSQLEFHPDSPERRILDKYIYNMLRLGFRIWEKDSGLK